MKITYKLKVERVYEVDIQDYRQFLMDRGVELLKENIEEYMDDYLNEGGGEFDETVLKEKIDYIEIDDIEIKLFEKRLRASKIKRINETV